VSHPGKVRLCSRGRSMSPGAWAAIILLALANPVDAFARMSGRISAVRSGAEGVSSLSVAALTSFLSPQERKEPRSAFHQLFCFRAAASFAVAALTSVLSPQERKERGSGFYQPFWFRAVSSFSVAALTPQGAFYQTFWFRAVALVWVLAFFFLLYQIRLRRIKEHNAALLQEITERKRTEALLAGEKRLLEMIATGVALENILEVLCQVIEEQRSNTLASVLLLCPDGIHLDSAAGPSLPEGWRKEIASVAIGPCAGSCGTAAYRKSAVIVSDIANDPLWDVSEHRAAALSYGLRASWSNPILTSDGRVLGTFCMYYRERRSPKAEDLELIELATHLARVAIERDRAAEALRQSEGFLADGQRISHTGSWSWNLSTGQVTWSDEHFRIFGFDPDRTEASFPLFLETVHPDDRSFIERGLDKAKRDKSGFDMEFRIAPTDGSIKNVQGVGRPVLTPSGDISYYIGTTVDITPRKRAEALLAGEKRLLEMVARGDSLTLILNEICRLVEELVSGALSSILLMEANGNRLRHGAAPSLPRAYVDAIDGSLIGPSAGSCGTAAYRAKPVIVSDIVNDPLWADYRDIALTHGLRACWSSPILSSEGKVMGTFAIYYKEPRTPTPEQLELIEQITHLASIGLERKRAEGALHASEQVARGQVAALVQSLDILATAPPPEKFIGQMLSTIGRLLEAQSVILWLLDDVTESLVLRARAQGANLAAIELEHPFVKDGRSWKENSGLQEVFFTGVPLACDDIENDPRMSDALRDYFRSTGTKKFLIIPTLVGQQVKGFIGIRHGDRASYRPEEIELAQALAHQAMFAIQLNEFARQSRPRSWKNAIEWRGTFTTRSRRD